MVHNLSPSDYSIQKKVTEEMSMYTDLWVECQRMWNKNIEVIPVIIGTTGIVGSSGVIWKNSQDPTTYTTAHILRKVLSIKPKYKQYMTI